MEYDQYHMPLRKNVASSTVIQPLTQIRLDTQYQTTTQTQSTRTHSHTRTSSSSVFPTPIASPTFHTFTNHSRRTPSNATISSTHSTSMPARNASTASMHLRRSTSSRSGQSFAPTSYVALMRKQKATVWCDRAQYEDPRLIAQAKAAKHRAAMEVIGGTGPAARTVTMGTSSLGVRSKIRHHAAPRVSTGYNNNLVGASVPMRLSASEVGDEDNSDDETDSQRNYHHQRNGSARSSLASSQRLAVYGQRGPGRMSQGSTPPNGSGPGNSPGVATFAEGATADADEGSMPAPTNAAPPPYTDYFTQPPGNGGSGSSLEREAGFGNVGDMNAPPMSLKSKVGDGKGSEDLNRRGSVDERTTTMRGVRLFVANPDADLSD